LCLSADVLIPAAGVAGLISGDMVRPGALVVDVGVNRIKDSAGKSKTVGDVDFEGVRAVAGWISPVPGGVGPMTVAVLLHNVIELAQDRASDQPESNADPVAIWTSESSRSWCSLPPIYPNR